MRIKEHMFPYPILREKPDDYIKTCFKATVSSVVTEGRYQLQFDMMCNNPDILKLIKDGKAKYAVHLECKATYFRRLHYSEKPQFSIFTQDCLWDLQVEICPMIVAVDAIENYTSEDLDDLYADEVICFKKGDYIAIGSQSTAPIIRNKDKLKQLSGPFCIQTYQEGQEQKYVSLGFHDQNQVVIYVPDELHSIISNVQGKRKKMEELHAALYFPALVQTIDRIRKNEDSSDEEKRWYIAINHRAAEIGIEDLKTNQTDPYVIAQMMFDYPLTRWMKKLSADPDEE